MREQLPLIWWMGIGHVPDSTTQMFQPFFPVWLIGEEPVHCQFVVDMDESPPDLVSSVWSAGGEVPERERRYHQATVRRRLHQPLFRTQVLHAYSRRCAVCGLPFAELLDAAHIQSDSDGGVPHVSNGLALCKIHHGAYDANIMGISAEYKVSIASDVLDTFDGPTLQYALKEMHGSTLRQLPQHAVERPNKQLLDVRFQQFLER
jgi:putative restriction endonuclease